MIDATETVAVEEEKTSSRISSAEIEVENATVQEVETRNAQVSAHVDLSNCQRS